MLESFGTRTRDKKSALKFLKKTMKNYGRDDEIVTQLLRSFGAVLRELRYYDRQETGRWLNNRAENSHQPFRRRERAMLRFRRIRTLQKFASVHASVFNHFNTERIKGADPEMTLQAICDRLEAMRERTPRGRSKWEPSSVKMILERAKKLGLLV